MATERPYRWSEFYNISIDECPHTCQTGTQTRHCGGKITTPCGTVLECNSECDGGDICINSECFTCGAMQEPIAAWECGNRAAVCTDHLGREYEKLAPVGPGCAEPFKCHDHFCTCEPATELSYVAMGYSCGTMADKCGGNVSLGDCVHSNSECVDNHCECEPTDYSQVSDNWNCGEAPSGCGKSVTFGDLGGSCPPGQLCSEHVCCAPAVYPSSYECGSHHDTCRQETTIFTSAQEEWQLLFRQTTPFQWQKRYWSPVGNPSSANYANGWGSRWRAGGLGSEYKDSKDGKLTFKLEFIGDSNQTLMWKQTLMPSERWCSKVAEGFTLLSGNDGGDEFDGLCRSGTGGALESGQRRRYRGAEVAPVSVGIWKAQPDGIPMLGGGFAKVAELWIRKLSQADGSCPNGVCLADHTCSTN